MSEYALFVKINDYAYEVWFEVAYYSVPARELIIIDHLLIDIKKFTIDDNMEFKVEEVAE